MEGAAAKRSLGLDGAVTLFSRFASKHERIKALDANNAGGIEKYSGDNGPMVSVSPFSLRWRGEYRR